MFKPMISLLLLLLTLVLTSAASAAKITAEKSDKGDGGKIVVKIDGKLFTEYLTLSGNNPVLWPVIGPTGKKVTRNYPLQKGKFDSEKHDHIHHRSFWFTHGDVDKTDFWHEGKNMGKIVHKKFAKIESGGSQARIVTENEWIDGKGKKVCEDVRTLTFGADDNSRWIDFDITIKATDGEVKFGDTKEGSLGIRVAGTMKVDAKKGGKIVNSEGNTNKAAWGKSAAWVDFNGPVEGETLGIAIMNHPSSFRYPTHWHARTYGLFAANPFGLKAFGKGKNGSHTIESGKSLTLRYRVLFHKGDEKQGKVAEAFAAYSKESKSDK